MDAVWIIITGFLVAASTGMLGNLLLLRKMSMMGDALSHAVLPGIVIAYMVSGSRASLPLFLGAIAMGVLTTFLISALTAKGRMQTDAAMGTVFTFLFALGVVMVTRFAGEADIDVDCVLHGEIAFVPLDTVALGPFQVPYAVLMLLGLFAAVQLVFWLGYKGWLLTSFNSEYARGLGIKTRVWHYVLMCITSVATVVSFESVGAILVLAFLVIPSATAHLLTSKLTTMVVYVLIIGFLSALGGYFIAYVTEGSVSGGMAMMSFALFLVVLIGRPKKLKAQA